jgi:glycerol kinase
VVNGDQTAAIYCLGRPQRTTAIVNIGTGAFLLLLTGENPVHHPALLAGLARSGDGGEEYTLEGTVNGAGAALEWACREWNIKECIRHLPDWLAREEEPPVFLNTIGGLGSPWWRSGPEPSFTRDGEPWQKAVAVAESILFLLQVNIDAMEKAGGEIRGIRISGGLARLDGMCRRLADLSRRTVYRPAETEATARGTAWLVAGSPRHWPKPGQGRHFAPRENRPLDERFERFLGLIRELPDASIRKGEAG